jgi:hypothetical protein
MINISPDAQLIGTLERRLGTTTTRLHLLESELQEVRDDIAILERMLGAALETLLKRPPPLPTHALPIPRLTTGTPIRR